MMRHIGARAALICVLAGAATSSVAADPSAIDESRVITAIDAYRPMDRVVVIWGKEIMLPLAVANALSAQLGERGWRGGKFLAAVIFADGDPASGAVTAIQVLK